MTAEELRTRFENLTLEAKDLSHREHVRLAWTYLRDYALLDVLRIFPANLKRYATSIGKDGLYHETITWAYLVIIAERMARGGAQSWDEFAEANGDLFASDFLSRYYDAATLASDFARRVFVFPAIRSTHHREP
ncbi:MAG TPA: hypothetical protein VF057_06975 [Thermoanaerobaculia bacterium]